MIDKVKVEEEGVELPDAVTFGLRYLHTMLRYLVSEMIKDAFRMFDIAINVYLGI